VQSEEAPTKIMKMRTLLFKLILVALGGAAPPLQLETRTTTPPTPLLVRGDAVIITDLPVDLEYQTTDEPINILPEVTVIPQVDFVEIVLTAVNGTTDDSFTTVSPITTTTDISEPATTHPPPPEPRLSGKERQSLIAHLTDVDLTTIEKLVLSPRQKAALTQELEYKRLGLPAFSDPTPWQRLNRDEQQQFNEKYLALRSDLREYSKVQFTSLPEEMQEHAYKMFLHLDIDTLTQVINRELERQLEAEKLFENDSVVQDFNEQTINNIQEDFQHEQEFQQEVHLFQEIPKLIQEIHEPGVLQADKAIQAKGSNNQIEDSLNQFQQKDNVEQFEEPRQQFQISAQQLQQLQQQIEQLEEPRQDLLQSSQQFQDSQQQQTEQAEQPRQKFQLSSQHLQQIQQEIELLEEPGLIQRIKQQFRTENDKVKEHEQQSHQPRQTTENLQEQTDFSEVPMQDFEQSSLQFQQQTEVFNSIEQPTERSSDPQQLPTTNEFQQPEIVREPLQQSTNKFHQPEIVREPLQPSTNEFEQIEQQTDMPVERKELSTTEFQQPEVVGEPLQHFQESTNEFEQIEEETERSVEPQQQQSINEFQKPGMQTVLTTEFLPQLQESTTEEQKNEISPQFQEQQHQQLPMLQQVVLVSEPQQQSQQQFQQPEQQTGILREPFQPFEKNDDQLEELRNQAPDFTSLFQQPTKIENEREQKPTSIFFQQNEQIKELRKEFRLTAKKFSQNLMETKQPKQPEEKIGKQMFILQEVQPITPQFLQPTQGFQQQPKQLENHFQQSEPQTFSPQQFQQQTQQPVEPNEEEYQHSQQSQQPSQQFQHEPRQDALQQSREPEQVQQKETFPNPIRQLQKISQDLKLRASQPGQRTRSRPIFDPRIRQQQDSRKRLQSQKQTQEPTPAELRHFQKAEAQIAKAIRLQECLNNPSSCQV